MNKDDELLKALDKMVETQIATLRYVAILNSEIQGMRGVLLAMHVNVSAGAFSEPELEKCYREERERQKKVNLEAIDAFLLEKGIIAERAPDDPWWDQPSKD